MPLPPPPSFPLHGPSTRIPFGQLRSKTVWNSTGVHTGIEFSEFNKRIFCIFFDNRPFLPRNACNPFYSSEHCNKLSFSVLNLLKYVNGFFITLSRDRGTRGGGGAPGCGCASGPCRCSFASILNINQEAEWGRTTWAVDSPQSEGRSVLQFTLNLSRLLQHYAGHKPDDWNKTRRLTSWLGH